MPKLEVCDGGGLEGKIDNVFKLPAAIEHGTQVFSFFRKRPSGVRVHDSL